MGDIVSITGEELTGMEQRDDFELSYRLAMLESRARDAERSRDGYKNANAVLYATCDELKREVDALRRHLRNLSIKYAHGGDGV